MSRIFTSTSYVFRHYVLNCLSHHFVLMCEPRYQLNKLFFIIRAMKNAKNSQQRENSSHVFYLLSDSFIIKSIKSKIFTRKYDNGLNAFSL